MDDLIAFLRERIDEDEQAALPIIDYMWDGDVVKRPYEFYAEVHGHVLRHDPARVLADVAAKRAIMDALVEADREAGNLISPEGAYANGLEAAVRRLADAYADHPDYREEWRP
jgi:hypothetical protein